MIDTQTLTVVDELPGPGGPDDMDLTADGRTLLLASRWARKLSVIDIASKKAVSYTHLDGQEHGLGLVQVGRGGVGVAQREVAQGPVVGRHAAQQREAVLRAQLQACLQALQRLVPAPHALQHLSLIHI